MSSLDYLICITCGTQHPTADRTALPTCFICDDPRQYTPPSGQAFTTLSTLQQSGTYHNEFHPLPITSSSNPNPNDDNNHSQEEEDDIHTSTFISITTTPKFAIGQRAILIRTPKGNVLWDCLSYLDDATVAEVQKLGGIQAMVISHPHFYSSHLEWAERFGVERVYLAREDEGWLARRDWDGNPEKGEGGAQGGGKGLRQGEGKGNGEGGGRQFFIERGVVEVEVEIEGQGTGVRVVKLGGHFPGSFVLLYNNHLLTADTLMMTPAGRSNWRVDALGNPRERPRGVNTFSFLWSIPNMIPLSADEIARMWGIIKGYDFRSAHGLFPGWDIEDDNLKARVLESMQIQIRAMGYAEHRLLQEAL